MDAVNHLQSAHNPNQMSLGRQVKHFISLQPTQTILYF